jgi:hypothetical protein
VIGGALDLLVKAGDDRAALVAEYEQNIRKNLSIFASAEVGHEYQGRDLYGQALAGLKLRW